MELILLRIPCNLPIEYDLPHSYYIYFDHDDGETHSSEAIACISSDQTTQHHKQAQRLNKDVIAAKNLEFDILQVKIKLSCSHVKAYE